MPSGLFIRHKVAAHKVSQMPVIQIKFINLYV